MVAIQLPTDRLRNEWGSGILDERLKNVLRIIGMQMDGIRLTCLSRTAEENAADGGVPTSKHLLKDGKVLAADFNPPWTFSTRDPDKWRRAVKNYSDRYFIGVDCVVIPHGTAPHVHIEIDPKNGQRVALLA